MELQNSDTEGEEVRRASGRNTSKHQAVWGLYVCLLATKDFVLALGGIIVLCESA